VSDWPADDDRLPPDAAAWQAAVYGRTADLVFRALRGLGG